MTTGLDHATPALRDPAGRPTGGRNLLRAVGSLRLLVETCWAAAGVALPRALSIVTAVLVARLLGLSAFGEFAAIQTTVTALGSIATAGLGLTAAKRVAELATTDRERAGRVAALSRTLALSVGLLLTVLVFASAGAVAVHALAAPGLARSVRLASIGLTLMAVNAAQSGTLSGLRAFDSIAKANTIAGVLSLPATLLFVRAYGVDGAVGASVLAVAINVVASSIALRHRLRLAGIRPRIVLEAAELMALCSFAVPAALNSLAAAPAHWFCTTLLARQPGGYAALGAFGAVQRIKQVPEALLSVLMTPVLPRLAEQRSKASVEQFRETLRWAFAASTAAAVPFALFIAANPTTATLVFGQRFVVPQALVTWMMLHTALLGLFSPFGSLLASTDRMWSALAFTVSWSFAYILFSYLAIPNYLGVGLAFAMAFAQLAASIPWFVAIIRLERVTLGPLKLHLTSLSLLALFAVVTFVAPLLPDAARIAAGAISGSLALIPAVLFVKSHRHEFRWGASRRCV